MKNIIYTKTAPTGKYLTQTSAVSEGERIFVTEVSGASDMLELDWRIATDKEVAEWQARKAEQEERDAQILAEQETYTGESDTEVGKATE